MGELGDLEVTGCFLGFALASPPDLVLRCFITMRSFSRYAILDSRAFSKNPILTILHNY